MKVVITDGGRAEAGYVGDAEDCVTRAIAIATQSPYRDVYAALADRMKAKGKPRSARNQIDKSVTRAYMASIGWTWVPTMQIGSGCRVHFTAKELPLGRLVVMVSRHACAVIDHVIYDVADPSRDGRRCVYGYYHDEQ